MSKITRLSTEFSVPAAAAASGCRTDNCLLDCLFKDAGTHPVWCPQSHRLLPPLTAFVNSCWSSTRTSGWEDLSARCLWEDRVPPTVVISTFFSGFLSTSLWFCAAAAEEAALVTATVCCSPKSLFIVPSEHRRTGRDKDLLIVCCC